MRVLIDPQIFNHQLNGGISRYISTLISGLRKFQDVSVYCPVFISDNHFVPTFNNSIRWLNPLFNKLSDNPGLLNFRLNNLMLKANLADIFIPSFYDTYFFNSLGRVKLILPIHDMIHEKYPDFISGSEKVIENKKKLIKRADHIISVSENTKNDLLNIYKDINPEKVSVIYHGNSIKHDELSASINSNQQLERYFLFVGLRGGYKQFDWLVESIADILINRNMSLLCIGGSTFTEMEQVKLRALNVSNRVKIVKANDEELKMFYKNAAALLFPSFYEGFGFPIIESMSCGCPVVLNTGSCFPEIASYAGYFYEFGDVQGIQKNIHSILDDNQKRKIMIDLGIEMAKRFTWENCLTETNQLLKTVYKNG
jgi:glycosyltransferase involved in cell wall biosynthesis